MNSETWLDMATRLHAELVPCGNAAKEIDEDTAARDRIKIALWLSREFSRDERGGSEVLPFVPGGE
jgi:hypothetical protein